MICDINCDFVSAQISIMSCHKMFDVACQSTNNWYVTNVVILHKSTNNLHNIVSEKLLCILNDYGGSNILNSFDCKWNSW